MTIDQDTVPSMINPSSATTETAPGDVAETAFPRRRWRTRLSRLRRRPRTATVLIVLGVVAVAVLTVVLTVWVHRPDVRRDQSAGLVIEAATSGATAVLSYSPSTVDRDVTDARSHLRGEFAVYYAKFAQDIVAPAAKTKGVEATAKVVRAAVSNLQADKATVLLYIDQSTLSKERPDPVLTASSVLVSLDRTDGRWLISKFEPI